MNTSSSDEPSLSELLDVSAQLYARLAHKMHIDALHEVPKRYVRILTLKNRLQVPQMRHGSNHLAN